MDDMSSAKVTIRYDGPALAGHRMDVGDLASALLGLSGLCHIANKRFNADNASIRVLIGTDVEHQCFQFDISVVQTIWQHTKALVSSAEVATAKEVLEWLGILSGSGAGVFAIVKALGGGRIKSSEPVEHDGRELVRVTIGEDNGVILAHPKALEILQDESALANLKRVLQPLMREGYETLEFERNAERQEVFTKADVARIDGLAFEEIAPSTLDQPQTMTAWVTVYSPVYDPDAKKWRFKLGNAHEYMDISQTQIARQAIERGGSMMDDAYHVVMEMTQEHKPGGRITNHYAIKEVLSFRPARLPAQADLFRPAGEG